MPCFFASSMSILRSSVSGTVFDEVTMRLPWRPVGMWPASARPWPLDLATLAMGRRDIRKVSSTPSLIRSTRSRGLAFVVKVVVAAERGAVEGGKRGVVGDAEELGQNRLAEQLGEGLALFVAALALAFEAMAEDFVEEDCGGAAAEDRRSVEGLGYGRGAQGFEALRQGDGLSASTLLVGQVAGGIGLEGLGAEQVHAVGGTRPRHDDKTRELLAGWRCATLGRDEVVGLVLSLELTWSA